MLAVLIFSRFEGSASYADALNPKTLPWTALAIPPQDETSNLNPKPLISLHGVVDT